MAKTTNTDTQASKGPLGEASTKDNVGETSDSSSIEVVESPDSDAAPVPVVAGAVCEVKDLYQGGASCPCCITWASVPQKRITTTKVTDTSGYAVLARKSEGHGDFGRDLKLHSLVIQSALIRKVLDVTLKGYPGISTGLENFTVEAPFSCFYHRWTALIDAYSTSTGETKQHLALLINLLDVEFRSTQKAVADLLKNNVIEHRYLWTIFQPGHYVTTNVQGQEAVLMLEALSTYDNTSRGGSRGSLLNASYIDFDGTMSGYGTKHIKIPEFSGTTPLSVLPALPFLMHPDRETIEKKRVAEGKRFAAFRMGDFQEYAGKAYTSENDHSEGETQVIGRVRIDAFAYFKFHDDDGLDLRPLGAPPPFIMTPPPPHGHHQPGSPPPPPGRGPPRRQNHHQPPPPPISVHMGGEPERKVMTDNEYLICVPFVRGYSFKNKEWVLLTIEYLRPVQWTEDLFENLVLPREEKDLLLALAKSHASSTTNVFDDFVIGKGKGMVILLDGPPGVGKTLTAESIAETMKAPLYTMSAGELGVESSNVEKKLSDILEMATMWNAILLIDEADIFMEQRSPHELERNELVSIFLRQMEYFHGVMVLTTNRVETMDLAFDSRVDIRLHYPPLPASSRRQIWSNFLCRLPGGKAIDEEELNRLAELDLNGRQIKSAVKTAQLLASGTGDEISLGYVATVLRITRGQVV